MALIKCKNCKKQISSAANKCIHCGEYNEPVITCPECKKENKINDKTCTSCGYPLIQDGPIKKAFNKGLKVTAKGMKWCAEKMENFVDKK